MFRFKMAWWFGTLRARLRLWWAVRVLRKKRPVTIDEMPDLIRDQAQTYR